MELLYIILGMIFMMNNIFLLYIYLLSITNIDLLEYYILRLRFKPIKIIYLRIKEYLNSVNKPKLLVIINLIIIKLYNNLIYLIRTIKKNLYKLLFVEEKIKLTTNNQYNKSIIKNIVKKQKILQQIKRLNDLDEPIDQWNIKLFKKDN